MLLQSSSNVLSKYRCKVNSSVWYCGQFRITTGISEDIKGWNMLHLANKKHFKLETSVRFVLGKWWNMWIVEYCLKPRLASAQASASSYSLVDSFPESPLLPSSRFTSCGVTSPLLPKEPLTHPTTPNSSLCTVILFSFRFSVDFLIVNIESKRYCLKYYYVVGSKSFRPDQLFKVTEIKQLCYFPT